MSLTGLPDLCACARTHARMRVRTHTRISQVYCSLSKSVFKNLEYNINAYKITKTVTACSIIQCFSY